MMQKDEHIVKMWTPLHFTATENYTFFPENILFKAGNILLRSVIYLIGPVIFRVFFGLRVIGKEKLEHLPEKAVTVCNHVHMLDCCIIACHTNGRSLCFPTLESNFRMPFVRHIIRILGGIPLPQSPRAFKSMNEAVKKHINSGHLVQLYPEGILYPRYDGVREFKRGAFTFAYDCNVPIVPYVIRFVKPEGFQKLFHRKKVMRLYVLDPVYPDTSRNKKEETMRLCKEVHDQMSEVFECNSSEN